MDIWKLGYMDIYDHIWPYGYVDFGILDIYIYIWIYGFGISYLWTSDFVSVYVGSSYF